VNDDYRSTSQAMNNNNSVGMRLSDHNIIEKIVKQFEENQKILIKQGKQIRAVYELQKVTNKRVTLIQNQMEKNTDDKQFVDLNPKVFSVSKSNFFFH
jgi:ribosomal protein S4E